MNRYFFYNTNLPSSLRNVEFLLREKCAVTSGGRSFGEQLEQLQIGDTLLMYENGTGVIGIGTITGIWDGVQLDASAYYPNPIENLDEYHIAVDWDCEVTKALLGEPIRLDEIRARFGSPGYTPRGLNSAVLAIDKHREAAAALVKELRSRFGTEGTASVARDIAELVSRYKDQPTMARREIEGRLGQGQFREDVFVLWGHCCAVTGSSTVAAIRASHIKPWSESDDQERLDPHNGIPLIATLDALFDKGLISFDATGRMLVKESLAEEERRILGVSEERQICLPSDATAKYLEWHRKHFKFES